MHLIKCHHPISNHTSSFFNTTQGSLNHLFPCVHFYNRIFCLALLCFLNPWLSSVHSHSSIASQRSLPYVAHQRLDRYCGRGTCVLTSSLHPKAHPRSLFFWFPTWRPSYRSPVSCLKSPCQWLCCDRPQPSGDEWSPSFILHGVLLVAGPPQENVSRNHVSTLLRLHILCILGGQCLLLDVEKMIAPRWSRGQAVEVLESATVKR